MARKRSRLSNFRRRVTRSDGFVGFLAWASSLFIRAYAATLRIEMDVHPEAAALDPAKVLYAFWHGRQFLLVPTFRHRNIAVMTDLSWAGKIQGRIMTRLGYPIVQGSSRRQPARALADMKRTLEAGSSAAFAVDGPGGPIHKSKPGVVYLAAKLGYHIVPVATSARQAVIIKSTWCKYLFPLPFARCLVALGTPLASSVEGTLTTEELDRVLLEWTEEADRKVGRTFETGA